MRSLILTTAIIDGALTIQIGVDALAFAANEGQYHPFDHGQWKVLDADKFASDVLHALDDEVMDDGTTILTQMIDKAIESAIEQGSEWIEEVIQEDE